MARTILCLNSGSSSLKFALYQCDAEHDDLRLRGLADRIGTAGNLSVRDGQGRVVASESAKYGDHAAACEAIFQLLARSGSPAPDAIGHRVVHGGPEHSAPALIDSSLIATLRELVRFAPLHLPGALAVIESAVAAYPGLPQVACFDTAFHRRMPKLAQRFPLPNEFWEQGVRRYGFHGLSYEYILETLGSGARGRLIIAHLGNGASMAAIRDGAPVDTTMGFTPTAGLMMGTRCGDLDPGVLVYLVRELGYDAERLNALVNDRSGLLGVSGISSDMQVLLDQRDHSPAAALAVALFCYQARKAVGALATALGGLDTLVLTGGIGEHAAPVRQEICRGLEFLGIVLDASRNAAHADPISSSNSRCAVRAIATNEERMIARHTRRLLSSLGPPPRARGSEPSDRHDPAKNLG